MKLKNLPPSMKLKSLMQWTILKRTPQWDTAIEGLDKIKNEGGLFTKTRKDELIGLLNKRAFGTAKMDELPPGMGIFGSRFIDEINGAGEMLMKNRDLWRRNKVMKKPLE